MVVTNHVRADRETIRHHGAMAIDLREMQDRYFRATAGPWHIEGNDVLAGTTTIANVSTEGNAEFIASSWRDVELLIGEVNRLRGTADTALGALELIRPLLSEMLQIQVAGMIDSFKSARS
jgi:hypothetical protein